MNRDFGVISSSNDGFIVSRKIDDDGNVIDTVNIEGVVYTRNMSSKEFKEAVYSEIYACAKEFNFKKKYIKEAIDGYWKYFKKVEKHNKMVDRFGEGTKFVLPEDYNYDAYNKDFSMIFNFNEKSFYTNISGKRFFKEINI